ncbi:Rrf2 family transcriptional regulator [Bacillus sp. 1P06AnD]|uniref:Rrf2 family transcriptional regulator n=1 Tax=Bacillus sp. 1P06AnD TaxID=3132208 RepID=UPI0039A2AE36
MAQLKRFGFAVQALLILAEKSTLRSSIEIAEEISCEPTALRKIMSQLAEAGFVRVKQGRTGGYMLAVLPEEITLFQVYASVYEEEPAWDRMLDTTGNHPFGIRVNESFRGIMEEIRTQVERVLGDYTLADLL